MPRSREELLAQLAEARKNITRESIAKAVEKRIAEPLDERLARFRIVRGENECWGWSGAQNRHGYGRMGVRGEWRIATHVALEADGRPRPSPAHCACHTCDNPECTNPRHLWWGTRKENTRDAIAKGRLIVTPKGYRS